MNGANGRKCGWLVLAAALVAAAWSSNADAQLLLRDDFDGTGIVDATTWRLPFGDSEGTFVGRTQFRGDSSVDMPLQGVAEPSATDGNVMEIHLDTYSPLDEGGQFLGTDLLSKRNFARAGGLTFEARMRLKPTMAGGLVNGFFVYDVQRENPPGTLVRDEIDFELLSNQATGAATHDPFTNYWNDEPFSDPGDGQFVNPPGLDLTQFQTYKVEWTPQAMRWYVNNQLVRTQTTNVPNDPMKLHFNLWAPNSDFSDAYNAALQPVDDPLNNQRYTVQVDHVEVNRINTTTSGNLLVDHSFEDLTPPAMNGTGGWTLFNNSFSLPEIAQDGLFGLKTYGRFFGGNNASGAFQNVVATPGEQFEGSIYAFSPSLDSIAGNQNYTTVTMQFIDSGGQILGGSIASTNRKDTSIYDGRDANMPQDVWTQYTVNGIAPAGTAYVRLNAFFIQLVHDVNMYDGGAVWFDNASLVKLTPNVVAGLAGDYNGDFVVDGLDYAVWRNNLGDLTEADINNNGDGNGVGETDFLYWKERYGDTLPGGGGLASVPEPAAALLALLAVFGLSGLRRR